MLIDLDRLEAHPANANVMSDSLLAKLVDHIRRSGQYPAIVVRAMVGSNDLCDGAETKYQILDGHHRALALRRLGRQQAECDVWNNVDDDRAAILLLTLNRLRGEDDPQRRGDLLARLSTRFNLDELQRRLPDDIERIRKLVSLVNPHGASARATEASESLRAHPLPLALTFFLPAREHAAVLARLREIDPDRGRALMIGLDVATTSGRTQ